MLTAFGSLAYYYYLALLRRTLVLLVQLASSYINYKILWFIVDLNLIIKYHFTFYLIKNFLNIFYVHMYRPTSIYYDNNRNSNRIRSKY